MHVPTPRASVVLSLAIAAGAIVTGCSSPDSATPIDTSASPIVQAIDAKLRRFAPVDITAPVSLPGNEPGALVAMRRRAALRSVCSHSAPKVTAGIRAVSAQRCGTF